MRGLGLHRKRLPRMAGGNIHLPIESSGVMLSQVKSSQMHFTRTHRDKGASRWFRDKGVPIRVTCSHRKSVCGHNQSIEISTHELRVARRDVWIAVRWERMGISSASSGSSEMGTGGNLQRGKVLKHFISVVFPKVETPLAD